jgi:outer membrane protein TolC
MKRTTSLMNLVTLALFGAPLIATHVVVAQQSPRGPVTTATGGGPTALSLGDAIRIAASTSTTAQTAQLRAREAAARVTQTRSALLPDISAVATDGNRSFNTASFGITFPSAPGEPPLFDPNGQVIGPVRTIDARGRVQQSIVDLSALARLRASRTQAKASGTDAAAVSEQAGTNAALAYIRALRAEGDLQARNADSVLAADLLGIAQNQLQAGVGIALDVTRAQSQLAATRAQLIASRNARDRAYLDLARALSLPLSTAFTLTDSLASTNLGDLSTDEATAVTRALQDRPDLKAAEQRILAARQAITATKAERLPSLSFVGDKGVNGGSGAYLLNTYQWGFQVSMPIFDGLRREGRIQEQQAQLNEAELQSRDLHDQAEADVRAALLDLTSATQQVDATRERERLAEQEVSQARDRFSAGVAGNADVITASLSLTSARTALIDALTNYQNARVALARAQGAVTKLP